VSSSTFFGDNMQSITRRRNMASKLNVNGMRDMIVKSNEREYLKDDETE